MWDGPAWIELRNRLVVDNLAWAHGIASRIARKLPTWFSQDDLLGAAEIALIKLSDAYRGYQDVPFRAFAIQRLRGACYDAIRRREYREHTHVSLEAERTKDSYGDGSGAYSGDGSGHYQRAMTDRAPNPEKLAQLAEMKGVWEHVHRLEPRHAQIICLIYADELSQAEVARIVKMSEPWVSKTHKRALRLLREMVER